MNNISQYKDGIIWPIIGICISFIGIPFFFLNIAPVTFILFAYLIWMVFKGKKGYTLVLISIALCIPGGVDGNISQNISDKVWYLFTIERITIIIIFLYNYFILKKEIPYPNALFLAIMIVLIGYFYSLYNNASSEYINYINSVIYIHLFFIICFWERIKLKNALILIDIIFILTTLYALFEYLHIYCPYDNIYAQAIRYDDILKEIPRAKGLLGHPLVLSGITIIYQAVIVIRLFIFKRVNPFLLILCLVSTAITTSRTTVIVLIIIFLYYYINSKMYSKIKQNVILLLIIFCSFALFSNIISPLLTNIIERFDDGADHRVAAFPSVLRLFLDNPLGVGSTQVTHRIIEYADFNLIRDFTLDNFFLTQIASYGVLAILFFMYYFFYFYKSIKFRHSYPIFYKCTLLLFLIFALMGFSFDIEAYMQILLLYYGLTGYLFSYFYKHQYVSYHYRKLQKRTEDDRLCKTGAE